MKGCDFRKLQPFDRASEPSQFPKMALPHIAMIGRSNVGKSSLINHLAQHKGLAKASASPGKTKAIDYFIVKDQCLVVDLPGYGYSKVASNLRTKWSGLLEAYLHEKRIACLLFLLDSRHLPSREDLQMWEWLRAFAPSFLIVLTKTDKLKNNEIQKAKQAIAKALELTEEESKSLIAYTTKDGSGRSELGYALEQKVKFGITP